MTRVEVAVSEVIALLQKSEFFSRLLADDLYWLASRSAVFMYSDGSTLFAPGQEASRFYIIRTGRVSVYRQQEDGQREHMAEFIAGDVLADFDFARQACHDVSADCSDRAEILVFPAMPHSAQSMAAERPDISARLLLRAVSMISSRVRSTQVLISENAPWVRELRKQMYTDAPTGLWLRSYLDEELPRKLLRAAPVAFVFLKPDRFKEYCDRWGHSAGDFAMARIAEILLDLAKKHGGWALRLRSNETALVLPGCTQAAARQVAKTVARAFAAIDLREIIGRAPFHFTLTASLALWPEDGSSLRQLVERNHRHLMDCWQTGGNRLVRLPAAKAASGEPA